MPTTALPLFVYGQLKLMDVADWTAALGDLRARQQDAAAVFGLAASEQNRQAGGTGLVWGQLLVKDAEALRQLDRLEAPEYMRVGIRLCNGMMAWAYEYVGVQPFFAMPLVPYGDYAR